MNSSEELQKLIVKLGSDFLEERGEAIEALSKHTDGETIDFLISLLRESDSRLIREGICLILGKINGEKGIDVLITALNDNDEGVRYQAAIALGARRAKRAVKPLIDKLTRHEDPLVRSEATKALGEIGDPKAVSPLINLLLKDEDRFVRYHAATALGMIGDKKALKALRKIIQQGIDDRLVLRAMEALEAIYKKASSKKTK